MWSPGILSLSLLLTATHEIAKNQSLQPWEAGSTKDYSNVSSYSVGTTVRFSWTVDFESPDLQL
jgi:hypothetical protein